MVIPMPLFELILSIETFTSAGGRELGNFRCVGFYTGRRAFSELAGNQDNPTVEREVSHSLSRVSLRYVRFLSKLSGLSYRNYADSRIEITRRIERPANTFRLINSNTAVIHFVLS